MLALNGELDERTFRRIAEVVHAACGVHLSDQKKGLVVSRLSKRLRSLSLTSFRDYADLLDESESERVALVNCITTNKTEFFREPHHFALLEKCLPELIAAARREARHELRIWCSACSTGEEVYTIAMVARRALAIAPGFGIRLLASDIDTGALEFAARGQYPVLSLEAVPSELRQRHFKPLAGSPGWLGIDTALRQQVVFRRINLISDAFRFREKVDIIFCRNVLIYFDAADKTKVVDKFTRVLRPAGYLFLGHSEGMVMEGRPYQAVAHTAYRLEGGTR